DPGRREGAHGPVRPRGALSVRLWARLGIWAVIAIAVVLATRALVYALAPQSLLLAELADSRAVGPDLTVPLLYRRGGGRAECGSAPRRPHGSASPLAARGVPARRGPTTQTGSCRGEGRSALRGHLVRVRDARVVHPLARRPRLARPALPDRTGPPR